MSQTFLIQQSIAIFIMTYRRNNIFVYTLFLYMLIIIIYQIREYIFFFNPTNSSIATPVFFTFRITFLFIKSTSLPYESIF